MSSRGREYVLGAAVGVWFAFALAACSEKARDVGGESHFVCQSDDDCEADSECVRESGSPTGKCQPTRIVGGSGGKTGDGGSGTGGSTGGAAGADDRSTGGSGGVDQATSGGSGTGARGGDAASGGSSSSTGGVDGGGIGTRPSGPGAPQAAVAFRVSPTPGKICAHTNGQLSVPFNVAGVLEALNCDSNTGCAPDEYVVVDGQPGTTVACSVTPNGSTFTVAVRLNHDGTATGEESIQFQASGVISKTGGNPVTIAQSNSVSRGGGETDQTCIVTVDAAHGRIDAGYIWANVRCENFRDPTDISETGCTLDAVFLFEGCSR